ncbi:MAG: hypothetical protein OXB93_01425 [Cytophagales bacterium]|nr:hypothetical protein [Cytophagales bacterium]
MLVFGLTVCLIALFFLGLSVRIWLGGGEFKGTCASQNPYLRTEEGSLCGYCGKELKPGEEQDCLKSST